MKKRQPLTQEQENKIALAAGIFSQPGMTLYHIYHIVDPEYIGREIERTPRLYAGFVVAESIGQAYTVAQNNDSNANMGGWAKNNDVRSTSIGDVIFDGSGFHMVTSDNFKLICDVNEDHPE